MARQLHQHDGYRCSKNLREAALKPGLLNAE